MLSNFMIATLAFISPLVSLVGAQTVPKVVSGECTGQSCYLASLSGSTGTPFKLQGFKKPEGGTPEGDACIKEYYKKLGLPPPQGVKRFGGGTAQDFDHSEEKRQAGECKANSVLYARGTYEEEKGWGFMVGPLIQKGLPDWYQEPVDYVSSKEGNFCLGLAGGYKAMSQLDRLAKRCPSTRIIFAGYSQGAMVARIGTAFSQDSTKKQIYGLALWGDPFNGAAVKGMPSSKVKTFCDPGDLVCAGEFKISLAHLSYKNDISSGLQWMKQAVA